MSVQPVGHEFKFTIGWNERNGSVIVEARQPDALMELHVLQLHRLAFAPWSIEDFKCYILLHYISDNQLIS